jgi:hypothetical protein
MDEHLSIKANKLAPFQATNGVVIAAAIEALKAP